MILTVWLAPTLISLRSDLVEILDPQQANTGGKTTCLSYLLVFFVGFSKLSQKYKICDKEAYLRSALDLAVGPTFKIKIKPAVLITV